MTSMEVLLFIIGIMRQKNHRSSFKTTSAFAVSYRS